MMAELFADVLHASNLTKVVTFHPYQKNYKYGVKNGGLYSIEIEVYRKPKTGQAANELKQQRVRLMNTYLYSITGIIQF